MPLSPPPAQGVFSSPDVNMGGSIVSQSVTTAFRNSPSNIALWGALCVVEITLLITYCELCKSQAKVLIILQTLQKEPKSSQYDLGQSLFFAA